MPILDSANEALDILFTPFFSHIIFSSRPLISVKPVTRWTMAARDTQQNLYVQIQFPPDYEMFCEECVDKENLKKCSPFWSSKFKWNRSKNYEEHKCILVKARLYLCHVIFWVSLQYCCSITFSQQYRIWLCPCWQLMSRCFCLTILIYFTCIYCPVKCRFSTISIWAWVSTVPTRL